MERPNPLSMATAAVFAVALVLVLALIPTVYQTNDDSQYEQVLEGNRFQGFASDAHSIYIHVALGSIVSFLATRIPGIAWYGLLMASLYVLAYTFIGINLPLVAERSKLRDRAAGFLLFAAAFALLSLLVFQFTILAGLLTLAGLLPCMRWVLSGRPGSRAMWAVATLCLILGSLVRFQMAAVVMMICLPALGLAFLWDRRWKPAGVCLVYVLVMGVVGSALYVCNINTYGSSQEYERLVMFHTLRMKTFDRRGLRYMLTPQKSRIDKHELSAGGHSGSATSDVLDQWRQTFSENDRALFSAWLAIETGPFSLESIRRTSETPQSTETMPASELENPGPPTDGPDRPSRAESSTASKLRGMLHGGSLNHLVFSLYLIAVFGAGLSSTAAIFILGGRREAILLGVTAAIAGGLLLLLTVYLDRAFFRVLFPCAYVFLILAVATFPRDGLRSINALSGWRFRLARGALVVVAGLGSLGVVLAATQIHINVSARSAYRELLTSIRSTIGDDRVVVAWGPSLHIEHQSPYKRLDDTLQEIYLIGLMTSHPKQLEALERRFGSDAYAGLFRPEVVHLLRPRSIEIMKRFFLEHYGRRVEAFEAVTFRSASEQVPGWVFEDVTDPDIGGGAESGALRPR